MYANKAMPKRHTRERVFLPLLLSMIFICMIINDLPLQQYLGTLGASPMWGGIIYFYVDCYS